MFSQTQVAEFKEAFQLMDHDKDGIIGKSDLRATFDDVGKLSNEKELDEMINEAPGPINFTQLLSLFALRMQDSGGSDDDEVVVAAFKSFDKDGVIDSETLVSDNFIANNCFISSDYTDVTHCRNLFYIVFI